MAEEWVVPPGGVVPYWMYVFTSVSDIIFADEVRSADSRSLAAHHPARTMWPWKTAGPTKTSDPWTPHSRTMRSAVAAPACWRKPLHDHQTWRKPNFLSFLFEPPPPTTLRMSRDQKWCIHTGFSAVERCCVGLWFYVASILICLDFPVVLPLPVSNCFRHVFCFADNLLCSIYGVHTTVLCMWL